MASEPAVNSLEDRIGENADMLRVSIHTEVGSQLAERYGFEFTPLFIVIDSHGEVIWRGNSVPSVEVVFSNADSSP
jgi:hypothetical protein